MKTIKHITLIFVLMIFSRSLFAQSYDLRITQSNTGGTPGSTVDFLCEITSPSGNYKLGGGNYVFTFNVLGLTSSGATLVNPNPALNSGLWTPMTLTTPGGTRISINTEYNGPTGSGLQITSGVWTTIATVRMVIVDPAQSGNLLWRTVTPSRTNAFLDDNTIELTYGTFTGVNNLLPVELALFSSSVDRNNVKLIWQTTSELNNQSFAVERKHSSEEWKMIGDVTGSGTTHELKNYRFDDRFLNTGKYQYRLKQTDFNGNFKYMPLQNEVEVGIPNKFEISQNYPNPFNPTTKINYDLPIDSRLEIKLFDISGREVANLLNTSQSAGYYSISLNASSLSSGVYFYQIIANGSGQSFVKTKKMLVVK